ncbi:class I SAM-dependent methyltransferase [Ramlibacter sp. PS3R-8]|uniref:class I SAM-dependent DNA methyltransferase n=1 Tax=Ramlibacter sp. PS3R-8 TaxID=3133437 RepID=UPI0030A5A889
MKVLQRSIKEPVIDGIRLPGFPPAELQVYTVGSAFDKTLSEASNFYAHVKAACARNGKPIRPGTEILDFGVSWGRVIRFFLKDVDAATLHGVDTSAKFLDAARQTGIPGHLHQIDPMGRLPYDDRAFDLAFAYSVFTHLPEHVQDHWLADIARTLRPGALLIATVEPPRFLDYFAALDVEDKSLHPWQASMARKIRSDGGLKARLQADGYVYIPEKEGTDGSGETYGDCVMTKAYVQQHWGRWFDIVEFLDDPKRFWQAVVVARVRG